MNVLSFHWLRRGKNTENQPLLRIRNLSAKVGIREVLTDINMNVYNGDQILITGPNGCGKSTLLNAIMGVPPARHTTGTITFNGKDITRLSAHEKAVLGIGYMRQQHNVFESLTVQENLRIAVGNNGTQLFMDRFPDWGREIPLQTKMGLLSGGQKKKIAWAMAVLQHPWLFLADEPDEGLSVSLSPPEDITVILISHNQSKMEKTNHD